MARERRFDGMARDDEGFGLGTLILTVLLVLAIGSMILLSIRIVPTGDVGVFTEFGKATQVLEPGLHFTIPLIQGIDMMPTQIQKFDVKNASAASNDLQEVTAEVVVNYRFAGKTDTMLKVFGDFRTEYEERMIHPLVLESVKAVTAKYKAEELITKREEVKERIVNLLSSKLSPYEIRLVEVSITNFEFSADFTKAIEQKMVAEQNKLQMQFELEKRQIEVQKQIAEANASATSQVLVAEGDAKSRIIRATAEAQAMQMVTAQVNDPYTRYYYITKWDGTMPLVTGNSNMIMQLPDLSAGGGRLPAGDATNGTVGVPLGGVSSGNGTE